jgi:5-bromo-4-chloroindolyl phosphate hydrolysis protein
LHKGDAVEVLANILTSVGLLAILGGGIAWGKLIGRVERAEDRLDRLEELIEDKLSRTEFDYTQREVANAIAEIRSIQKELRTITSPKRSST